MSLELLVAAIGVGVAMWVDHRWGEPPAWLHPVVAMGRYLGRLGPVLTRLSAGPALVGGGLAWLVGAVAVTAMAMVLQSAGGKAVRGVLDLAVGAGLIGQSGVMSEGGWACLADGLMLGLLLKPMLAWRMLHDEVQSVEGALQQSLEAGRMRLRHLVSREVAALDEAGVRESAIESLAENLNDSLVAPLFWFAIGGLPAAALYRFANTADAMWGYRGRYEWAGKWAARADDVLSWVPARITAGVLCMASGRWPGWRLLRQTARVTPSPNGGWPMGAMALNLNVCLRKPGVYALNAQAAEPDAAAMAQALHWGRHAAWLAAALAACTPMLIGTLLSGPWLQGRP